LVVPFAFAMIVVFLEGLSFFLPFSFKISVSVKAPQTELVPLAVTLMPAFFGLTFTGLSACAVQLPLGKFTHA
jgi:hypothetical protein